MQDQKTIYDVQYIGVYYSYKMEFSGIDLFKTREDVKVNLSFENTFFKVKAIKEFEGKKDILKIEFDDGTIEYETLYEPGMFYDNDKCSWEETEYRKIPEKFLELFNE